MAELTKLWVLGVLVQRLEIGDRMQGDSGNAGHALPVGLMKRIEELQGRETSYIEDELYSQEALTNLKYRSELEKLFRQDPLGPLPARQG